MAIRTLLALAGTFKAAGSALFFVFYLYGTVGVVVFGGRIRVDAPSLKHTPFADSVYFANNFNDFASGLVVLFELMVINNWFVIAGGLAAITPNAPYVAWLFCITFYACIHTVILNVLITSVVETYGRLRLFDVSDDAAPSVQGRCGCPNIGVGLDSLLTGPIRSIIPNENSLGVVLDEEALLLDEAPTQAIKTMRGSVVGLPTA